MCSTVDAHPDSLILRNELGNLLGDQFTRRGFSGLGTLSSRSSISASAPAWAALSSMDSLLPGTNRNDRTGFIRVFTSTSTW